MGREQKCQVVALRCLLSTLIGSGVGPDAHIVSGVDGCNGSLVPIRPNVSLVLVPVLGTPWQQPQQHNLRLG